MPSLLEVSLPLSLLSNQPGARSTESCMSLKQAGVHACHGSRARGFRSLRLTVGDTSASAQVVGNDRLQLIVPGSALAQFSVAVQECLVQRDSLIEQGRPMDGA